MDSEPLAQRPEGQLLEAAAKADGRAVRKLAPLAGISEARWRQIVKGSMPMAGGTVEVVAPASTLARMAAVLNLTPAQLVDAGRDDAALVLERGAGRAPQSFESVARISASKAHGALSEEIEMIYASGMTAEQKLKAIRIVLDLTRRVEQDRAKTRRTPGAPEARETAPAQDAGAEVE